MNDIREARQRIRELITPVKRKLSRYKLKETLGNPADDDITVEIEIDIDAAKDYPAGTYQDEEYKTKFIISKVCSREEVIAEIHGQVEKKVPHWKKKCDEDADFAKCVGRKMKLRQKISYFVNRDSGRRGLEYVPVGVIGTVIRHVPARFYVDFGLSVGHIPVETWMYTSGSSHFEDPVTGENLKTVPTKNSVLVFVPDPYWEWVD